MGAEINNRASPQTEVRTCGWFVSQAGFHPRLPLIVSASGQMTTKPCRQRTTADIPFKSCQLIGCLPWLVLVLGGANLCANEIYAKNAVGGLPTCTAFVEKRVDCFSFIKQAPFVHRALLETGGNQSGPVENEDHQI